MRGDAKCSQFTKFTARGEAFTGRTISMFWLFGVELRAINLWGGQ
jgi:hypothetical protein